MKPVIRTLENGDKVLDFGRQWFRISGDQITTKRAMGARGVVKRDATPKERNKVLRYLDCKDPRFVTLEK